MKKINKEELLKKANGWVYEAQWAAREWRKESWRDCEMYDGGSASWTAEDYARAQEAGIDPITINRTFPTVNMLKGNQAVSRLDIVAKGRTKDDSEIGQVMTEGIKFISDQCSGEFLISQAFSDAIVPGIGCIAPGLNVDPRQEKLTWKLRDWKEIWWDPYSSPWWSPTSTRYLFWQRWVDLDDIKAIFPEKKKEIDNAYNDLVGDFKDGGVSSQMMDEAQMVEEHIRMLSASDWIDTERKRIRPVEMWYPVNELCMFALYADGRCYELRDDMDPNEAFQMIQGSQQILKAIVKKMRVMTFFGADLMLQDEASPYDHDQYPMVPFVGYIDRYGMPYGVPRQIRGQNTETNKRRSMALAMMQKRRVIAEKGVVQNGDKDALDILYEEANKIDGFMVIEDGKMGGFKLDELVTLAGPQIELMRQSEIEIQEISGVNGDSIGYDTKGKSGIAKKMDLQRSAVTTATLFDNLRRSMKMIGDQTISNMQKFWRYEKVLRVTDRITGAERFVTVNQQFGTGIKHNITQGKFDTVISEAQASDTVREKNMDILYAAIEKSPPEAVSTLLIAAFEMSDLPNKELLVEKLKPILNIDPTDESEDPEAAKQRVLQELQAQKEQAAIMAQIEQESIQLELNKKRLENAELEAKIQKVYADIGKTVADTEKTEVETDIAAEDHDVDLEKTGVEMFEKGMDLGDRILGKDQTQAQGVV